MINKAMPLNIVSAGRDAEVRDITGTEVMCKKLMEMGFNNGAVIRIIKNDAAHIVVKVGETRLALNRGMAQKVMVAEV
ncbi:ferrous iron transport protein A [Clostridium acetobutylicum]|jgi:ferrous iron transport protein A|uniref:FeoA-like protein, involved in iron transport n=1 Tax=Clostridium acetobutylicum (strain ATCC 824 / DSM 792 / JCM 1419 / IAM 19013 / LMG 5710 / NBRC 13948 / NRRL B-527 / VKM B-1787 / 2291 / W) TaxID=272562 RepID=Q97K89_CLOAB|nr:MULTISPECIES: ferrous iron transport protein A [Clostridium]AAK79006.1 FeoA-like protein, involved in iron transport [Clostridium acetobutylicum ATCC 824]ADZ20081.1 FeoA-like protein [Clostridium acetobutylicum EA 2018]AEI31565.1 FeoA-like protein, involved in iron transport [Clostridium acetobutylicum DSM 1731]AWV81738.1 ferrous iron transport protein A [Clostridium acetobutylicum]MBC2395280.1 ferrous iron transport protein A [Clostridium acetobutylicum]